MNRKINSPTYVHEPESRSESDDEEPKSPFSNSKPPSYDPNHPEFEVSSVTNNPSYEVVQSLMSLGKFAVESQPPPPKKKRAMPKLKFVEPQQPPQPAKKMAANENCVSTLVNQPFLYMMKNYIELRGLPEKQNSFQLETTLDPALCCRTLIPIFNEHVETKLFMHNKNAVFIHVNLQRHFNKNTLPLKLYRVCDVDPQILASLQSRPLQPLSTVKTAAVAPVNERPNLIEFDVDSNFIASDSTNSLVMQKRISLRKGQKYLFKLPLSVAFYFNYLPVWDIRMQNPMLKAQSDNNFLVVYINPTETLVLEKDTVLFKYIDLQ